MKDLETRIFNRPFKITEGWYWLIAANKIKIGKSRAVTLMGRDLVVFRGENTKVVALDAYCPHMGAHLAEGKVEGNAIRCFFHNWKFNADGQCVDIPCLAQLPSKQIITRSWHVLERYGLIWIWIGEDLPTHDLPVVPGFSNQKICFSLGNHFEKKCHPNVVMVNAIDEQHFHTVHKLPGSILKMEPEMIDRYNILFSNTGYVPKKNWFGRLIARFYKGPLTYSLSYWYGHLGFVTLGPDFLQLHLMFALRQTEEGKTEGYTIAFTKERKGILGFVKNKFILFLTKLGGRYFAIGDTRIFQTIKFDFKTPIVADRAVIFFIKHLEQQKLIEWNATPTAACTVN